MRISSRQTTVAVLRCFLELKTPEMAEISGLSLSAIEKIESGRLKLSDEAAVKIAMATGVEKQWLLDGDPAAPIRPQVKVRVREGAVTMLPREYSREVFEQCRAKSPVPVWNPQDEAARMAGIVAGAYKQSKVAIGLAKYKTDEALNALEKMCGMHAKRRDQYQRVIDGGLRLDRVVTDADRGEEVADALRRILKDADRDEPISRKDVKAVLPLLKVLGKYFLKEEVDEEGDEEGDEKKDKQERKND